MTHPQSDDVIILEGGAEGNRGSLVVRDPDVAVVGGTGRYKGAMGEGKFEKDAKVGLVRGV